MAKSLIINKFSKGVTKQVFIPTADTSVVELFAKDFLDGQKIICKEIHSSDDKSKTNDKATVVLKNKQGAKSMYLSFYVNNTKVDDRDIDNLLTGLKVDGLVRDDVRTTLYNVNN